MYLTLTDKHQITELTIKINEIIISLLLGWVFMWYMKTSSVQPYMARIHKCIYHFLLDVICNNFSGWIDIVALLQFFVKFTFFWCTNLQPLISKGHGFCCYDSDRSLYCFGHWCSYASQVSNLLAMFHCIHHI